MCISICYVDKTKIVISYFAQPEAQLPVQMKSGDIEYLPWGRRQNESGVLPLGGWINWDLFRQGKFDYYLPKLVKIPIKKFMEADIEGRELWFDVIAGQYLQGVYLHEKEEQRVYVLTITPETPNNIYSRWPRIGLG
jgi:hypothetical protein